jgi:hypothetical protein
MRWLVLTLLTTAVFGVLAQSAFAAGGTYSFAGGTATEQATVRNALHASSFDWGLLPQAVVVHIGAYGDSYSTYGNVFVDASLLHSGRFAWGVVQHEFAHQVDFMLFDAAKRAAFEERLGGKDWCYSVSGLKHSDYGCERFASELSWAYWGSPANSMRPAAATDEAAGMPVAQFRALLAQVLGAPGIAAAPGPTTAFAPAKNKKR